MSPWAGARKDFRWIFRMHHICTASLYVIFILCVFMNFYVLLSRDDTIYYLRIYHSISALLMICCGIVELEFLVRTRDLPKLHEPHEIPGPALIGAVALTLGIALGYLYFIVFNYAFKDCDKLVDAIYDNELWLESGYDLTMVGFSVFSLVYVLQRRYYGAINSNLDKVGRLFINITFSVVWLKVVIYKGYLSHQELCQRKELEGYWCPAIKRNYDCVPGDDLHGTEKMWYYINKGILSTAVISCASEFFPVMLVTHWLVCGGAEEKAELFERKRQRKLGVRGLMRELMKDISRVYTGDVEHTTKPLKVSEFLKWCFWVIVPIACAASSVKWLVSFYWTIDFDRLVAEHWKVYDIVALVADCIQFCLFSLLYFFARHYLEDARLDSHHKAHARGDISILFGCCAVLTIKLILQCVEVEFQRRDGFITLYDSITSTVSYVTIQGGQWLQYFAVRRILAMSDRDCIVSKRFIPLAAFGGLLLAWIHFGITFFDTSLIKYTLTDETFEFSQTSLICMIFTQTIFPADYLFAFTVSGCYLELLQRYLNMGFFQLGDPIFSSGHHGHGGNHGGHGHGDAIGKDISQMNGDIHSSPLKKTAIAEVAHRRQSTWSTSLSSSLDEEHRKNV